MCLTLPSHRSESNLRRVQLEGYRTITANALILLAAVLAMMGVVFPQDEQTAIIAGVIAAGNLVLRVVTTGRVFFRR
jgi:hypothetical protein